MTRHHPWRSLTCVVAASASVVLGGAAMGIATGGPSGADPAPPTCAQTMVVVEWHNATNAPTTGDGMSKQCTDPGTDPFDALKNAQFNPITQVENAVGTILCAILNAPATKCDELPPKAAWTYWYVDPAGHDWHGPYQTPPTSAGSAGSSGSGGQPAAAQPAAHGQAAAGSGTDPSTAPAVEDWVYQSDYPAQTDKPAYFVDGNPPTSAPPTTPTSGSPTPTGQPTGTAPAPSGSRPVLPAPPPPHSGTTTSGGNSSDRPQPGRTHSHSGTHTDVADGPANNSTGSRSTSGWSVATSGADGGVAGSGAAGTQLPAQWWIAADRPTGGNGGADLAREGQAPRMSAAAATSPGGGSSHRLAWSTGLGSAALILLGLGIFAQLRRRRTG